MELFNADLERISDNIEKAIDRVPALQNAEITRTVSGPITYTPDLLPMLGPAQGLNNYWLAVGFGSVNCNFTNSCESHRVQEILSILRVNKVSTSFILIVRLCWSSETRLMLIYIAKSYMHRERVYERERLIDADSQGVKKRADR